MHGSSNRITLCVFRNFILIGCTAVNKHTNIQWDCSWSKGIGGEKRRLWFTLALAPPLYEEPHPTPGHL